MPIFEYTVLDSRYQNIRGKIDASDTADAVTILRAKEWRIVSIRQIDRPKRRSKVKISPSWVPVYTKDIISLLKQLKLMVGAGLTLYNSIAQIEEECGKPSLKAKLKNIRDDIQEGMPFSEAIHKQKDLLSESMVKIIQTAELTGEIGHALDQVIKMLQFRNKLKSQLVATFSYPLIVLTVSIIVNCFLVFVLVPSVYENVISQSGRPLPKLTQGLVIVSHFGRDNWHLIALSLLAFIFGFILILRTSLGRLFIESWILRVPILGRLILVSSMVKLSGTMSVMLSSGINILDSINMVSKINQLLVFKKIYLLTHTRLLGGMPLRDALQNKYFPATFYGIISAGENSGKLDKSFKELEIFYSEELEARINTMTTFISPCILFTVALLVGIIYYSIFNAAVPNL